MTGIVIPVQGGRTAIVDAIDSDLVDCKWWINANNYGRIGGAIKKTKLAAGKWTNELMHRIVMRRILERDLLKSEEVDHINGNTLDNRRDNLRVANRSQNMRNRGKPTSNTTGYKGVYKRSDVGRWIAAIKVNGKQIHLGYFDTAEDAYDAYLKASVIHHGQFAHE